MFQRKRLKLIALLTMSIGFFAFTIVESSDWKIKSDFSIRFSSEEPSGVFTDFSGEIIFDSVKLQASKFNLKLNASSINTGNGMKNRHAKSEDWLDAEKYPSITFTSKVFSTNIDFYEVSGILNLHGVKKEIIIPFSFKNQVFSGNFKVRRQDYNIGKSTGIYSKVSDEITIDFDVPVSSK